MIAIARWVGESTWPLCRLLLVWCRLLLLSLSAFFFRIAQCIPSNDDTESRCSSTESLLNDELINQSSLSGTSFRPALKIDCVDSYRKLSSESLNDMVRRSTEPDSIQHSTPAYSDAANPAAKAMESKGAGTAMNSEGLRRRISRIQTEGSAEAKSSTAFESPPSPSPSPSSSSSPSPSPRHSPSSHSSSGVDLKHLDIPEVMPPPEHESTTSVTPIVTHDLPHVDIVDNAVASYSTILGAPCSAPAATSTRCDSPSTSTTSSTASSPRSSTTTTNIATDTASATATATWANVNPLNSRSIPTSTQSTTVTTASRAIAAIATVTATRENDNPPYNHSIPSPRRNQREGSQKPRSQGLARVASGPTPHHAAASIGEASEQGEASHAFRSMSALQAVKAGLVRREDIFRRRSQQSWKRINDDELVGVLSSAVSRISSGPVAGGSNVAVRDVIIQEDSDEESEEEGDEEALQGSGSGGSLSGVARRLRPLLKARSNSSERERRKEREVHKYGSGETLSLLGRRESSSRQAGSEMEGRDEYTQPRRSGQMINTETTTLAGASEGVVVAAFEPINDTELAHDDESQQQTEVEPQWQGTEQGIQSEPLSPAGLSHCAAAERGASSSIFSPGHNEGSSAGRYWSPSPVGVLEAAGGRERGQGGGSIRELSDECDVNSQQGVREKRGSRSSGGGGRGKRRGKRLSLSSSPLTFHLDDRRRGVSSSNSSTLLTRKLDSLQRRMPAGRSSGRQNHGECVHRGSNSDGCTGEDPVGSQSLGRRPAAQSPQQRKHSQALWRYALQQVASELVGSRRGIHGDSGMCVSCMEGGESRSDDQENFPLDCMPHNMAGGSCRHAVQQQNSRRHSYPASSSSSATRQPPYQLHRHLAAFKVHRARVSADVALLRSELRRERERREEAEERAEREAAEVETLKMELEDEQAAATTAVDASLELIRRLQEEKASEHMTRVHETRVLKERVSHDEDILREVADTLQGQQMEILRLSKQLHMRLGYVAASVSEQDEPNRDYSDDDLDDDQD